MVGIQVGLMYVYIKHFAFKLTSNFWGERSLFLSFWTISPTPGVSNEGLNRLETPSVGKKDLHYELIMKKRSLAQGLWGQLERKVLYVCVCGRIYNICICMCICKHNIYTITYKYTHNVCDYVYICMWLCMYNICMHTSLGFRKEN
jgi:hypothetical protein